jgi:hypothetical protein
MTHGERHSLIGGIRGRRESAPQEELGRVVSHSKHREQPAERTLEFLCSVKVAAESSKKNT